MSVLAKNKMSGYRLCLEARRRTKALRAFTLVELLIVVAIVGVLATVGIPTYKKMVRKARQAEPKANLAAVFTVESAFFAEYGAYGNNLGFMGYQITNLDIKNILLLFADISIYDIGVTNYEE